MWLSRHSLTKWLYDVYIEKDFLLKALFGFLYGYNAFVVEWNMPLPS